MTEIEAGKWYTQAEADLRAAQDSITSKHYDWACFQAQQAAEKAVKFFLYDRGYTSIITHSLKELVRECKKQEKEFSELESYARTLDMFYIPTRRPNGLAGDLSPAEFYEEEDAVKCASYAASILTTVKKIYDNIEEFASRLKEKFHCEVYLYGSCARGKIHEGSDIDLIVVGDFKDRFIERIGKVLDLTDLPVEPLVYTHEEFEKMKENNLFIRDVLKYARRLA